MTTTISNSNKKLIIQLERTFWLQSIKMSKLKLIQFFLEKCYSLKICCYRNKSETGELI